MGFDIDKNYGFWEGGGHFNGQSNDYVLQRFADLGYERNNTLENTFRSSATLHRFCDTVIVLQK